MAVKNKVLALCLAFLMVFSCAACGSQPAAEAETRTVPDSTTETSTDAAPAAEGWTIFVYMCGSDLESDGGGCASADIGEMIDATYSDKVNVVIETGGAYDWQCEVDPSALERYERTSESFSLVDSQPVADMGEESTLESFLAWGLENYSSEHMGLIFWNHGGGSISGVCFDETCDYDSLSLSDIGTALKNTMGANKFEFVGFDACLMATLEAANMLVPYANYMYASEEVEPGTGWDYTPILNYLAENPGADGKELGEVQCSSYYDSTQLDEEDPSVTFSITDLSKIGDLVTAFDQTCKELSECENYAPIARGILSADNFGGNNRTEGYTNMVDMADMLRNVSEYAPSAENTLQALSNAVICYKDGDLHANAGGLALYYPLRIQGSQEIPTFREICPSTYYYALVANVAANADLTLSSSSTGLGNVEDSETITVNDVYLDEGGNYTVELANMDEFAFATCSVFMDVGDNELIYIGEDDEVKVDYDEYIIQDSFDGTWLWLNGEHLLPIQLISRDEHMSLYTCTVLRNGEQTNLEIAYDWDEGGFKILGTYDGIDSETGMASRPAEALAEGDVLNIVYYCCDASDDWADNNAEWYTYVGDDITVSEDMEIYYDTLTAGDYYYMINLYDIYGNGYILNYTVFNVDEEGSVSFYTD